LFDSQTPTCSNYDSPSASRDNSIDIANYKQVLGQLQKRYADVHLKKNKQSETTLTSSEMLFSTCSSNENKLIFDILQRAVAMELFAFTFD
jgi:hypothetical protein